MTPREVVDGTVQWIKDTANTIYNSDIESLVGENAIILGIVFIVLAVAAIIFRGTRHLRLKHERPGEDDRRPWLKRHAENILLIIVVTVMIGLAIWRARSG